MRIQLESLRAINSGPLRDVCIHFNVDGDNSTTVLAGSNGSGKTTVLELIVGLAEMLLPNSQLPPVRPAMVRSQYVQANWLVDGQDFSLFYGKEPRDANLSGNHLGRTGINGTVREQEHGSLARHITALIQRQEAGATIDPFNNASQDNIQQSDPTVPSVLFFPHTRFLLPVVGDQMHKEAVAYQWVYFYQIASEFKGSLDSYLVWLDYVEPAAYASAILFLNDLNIDGKTFGISRRDFKAIVTTSSGDTHFLEDMSSGEQNILIMLLELRRRLIPHSIVLIDEIENSLHPAFQKKLAELLKRMQKSVPFQLIITTHSIAIVESFGPASVRILTEF